MEPGEFLLRRTSRRPTHTVHANIPKCSFQVSRLTDDQLTALPWLLRGVLALRNVSLAVVLGQGTRMLT